MEKHLKKLKRSMDNTVFKDVPYDRTRSISSVLTPLDKERKSNIQTQPSKMKNKLNFLLSISVVSMMFLGITYFVGTQLNLLNFINGNQAESTKKSLNQETVYIPPKQEENFKEMTKEEILTKMLNSVDYFETAKGEFKVKYADKLGETLIEYELSLNNKAGGYSKENYITEGAEKVTSLYYKDGTKWTIDENSGSYVKGTYDIETQASQSETLTIEEAFTVDNKGNEVFSYRNRTCMASARGNIIWTNKS